MSKTSTTVYGHDKTIHRSTDLNVEIGPDGSVVAVWFRCMPLPFQVSSADPHRAEEMVRMYADNPPLNLIAVELEKLK